MRFNAPTLYLDDQARRIVEGCGLILTTWGSLTYAAHFSMGVHQPAVADIAAGCYRCFSRCGSEEVQYGASFKHKVIQLLGSESNQGASRTLSVAETKMQDWRKESKAIFLSKKFTDPEHGRFPELEDSLAEFIKVPLMNLWFVTSEITQVKTLK